nr:lysylphosphatidylglycerol synthase domain-containing protein [Congregibacter sp.]
MLRRKAKGGKILVVVAALLLVIASVVSWRSLGISFGSIYWPALLASAGLVPALIYLTALEYQLIANVNRLTVPIRHAVIVTVVGSIANLLPIPGTSAVRIGDILRRDGNPADAMRATLAAGLLWIGWALILAGFALTLADFSVSLLFLAVGIFFLGASGILINKESLKLWLSRGSAIEVATILVAGGRLMLVFLALDLDAPVVGILVLVAANAIASMVGIVPGGLGLREAVAALLAPLVGIEPAAAVLAVTLARVLGLCLQAPIALVLGRRSIS